MELWSRLLAGEPVPTAEEKERMGRSPGEMKAALQRAAERLAKVSRAVADRNGWDEVWLDPIDQAEKSYGGAIAHIITHSMHHRAQLLYLLRRLGLTDLPEGDVLSWEQQIS